MSDEINCSTCGHAREAIPPGSVQRVLQCTGAPPSSIFFPNGGLGSAFPIVQPAWACGQWKQKEVKLANVTSLKPQEKTGEKPA